MLAAWCDVMQTLRNCVCVFSNLPHFLPFSVNLILPKTIQYFEVLLLHNHTHTVRRVQPKFSCSKLAQFVNEDKLYFISKMHCAKYKSNRLKD